MTNTIFLVLLVICLVFIINTQEEARKKDKNHGASDTSRAVKNRHQLKDDHHRRSHMSLEKGGNRKSRSVKRRSRGSKSRKDGSQVNANTATLAPAMPLDFAVKAEVLVDGYFSLCPSNMSMQCPGCRTSCPDSKPCSVNMTTCVTSEQLCDCDYQKGFVRDYLTPRHYECILQSDCMKCPQNQKPTCYSDACPVVTCDNNAQWIERVSYDCTQGIQDCRNRQCDCDYENGYVRQAQGKDFKCIKRAQCISCNDTEVAVCPAPQHSCTEVKWSNKVAIKKKHPCPSEPDDVQNCTVAPVCHCKKPYLRNDDDHILDKKGECVSYNHFCQASYSEEWSAALCLKLSDCVISCNRDADINLPFCAMSGTGPEYEKCWDGAIEGSSFECGCHGNKLLYLGRCVTKEDCYKNLYPPPAKLKSRRGKRRG